MYLDMRRDHLHIHKLCFVFISTDEYYKMTMNTVNDLRCILIEIQKKKEISVMLIFFTLFCRSFLSSQVVRTIGSKAGGSV